MSNNIFTAVSASHFKSAGNMVTAFLYKDYSVNPHNHDFYEMNIIMSGKGTHTIEGTSVYVKRGDIFMIPPNTVHSYCDTQVLDVYHILFHFPMLSG